MTSRYITITLCLMISVLVTIAQEVTGPQRWEEDIAKFEALDKENFPPEKAILFVGSSSIRLWKLEDHFPDLLTINRGFGGSKIADSHHYADRIVIPYKPKAIVFYAGDNDIGSGMTPRQVFWDYQAFVKKVHDALPDSKIIFIAIKPSIKRWDKIKAIRKANHSIQEWSNNYPFLKYLDIDTPMIGGNGEPKSELFAEDGLHLNEVGYKLWSEQLKPLLPLDSQ